MTEGSRLRVALLTREYPPEVYGGAGVHVEYLARELDRLVDADRALLRRRPARAAASAHRPWEAARAANAGARGGVGRPGDGRRRRGRAARPQPHLVREPRRPPREAPARDPARRDGAQPRAAAAVEGRAARRRLRRLVAGASGRRSRRPTRSSPSRPSMRRDLLGCYPAVDPERVSVIDNGIDTEEYRPDPGTDVARAVRRRPGAALRRLRRPDHAAEGADLPARRRRR